MSIIGWIILGLLAGWIANTIVRGSGAGLLLNLVLGIVGAFVGGFLVSILGGAGVTGFNLWSLIVATLGAVVVLWAYNALSRRRSV